MSAKAFFRHLCSELDGFYVKSCVYFLNKCVSSIKTLFYYMQRMQVGLEADSQGVVISESDMEGIGIVAGVFVPYITAESSAGNIRFTSSAVIDGVQYSERGLFNRETETFSFYRTDQASYPTDINTLASEENQTSLVEDGAAVLGYIPENVNILNTDGTVNESLLVASEQPGMAAYPYYGKQYLHLAETFEYQTYMLYDIWYYLFLAMQRIRYNGPSIKDFLYVTELLMQGYVKDVSFTNSGLYTIVYYTLDTSSGVGYKLQRVYTWTKVTAWKFPQFVLSEITT
jgi:hypothetical protein